MFFKGSRYKDLTEISAIDARGRIARSKTLRLIPDTPGTFSHTVNQTDRLDLLAYKYYGDSKKWWLICDANPGHALPTDLLDQHPIVHKSFNLQPPDGDNKWSILIRALKELKGIHILQIDFLKAILYVTYNQKELDRETIESTITAQGYEFSAIAEQGRVGQKIIIPPNKLV